MCIFVFYLEHKLFQLQMQFQTVKKIQILINLSEFIVVLIMEQKWFFFFIEWINFIVNFAKFFSIWNMKIIYKVGQIGEVYMMSKEPRWSKTQSYFSGICCDTPKDIIGNLPRIWFHNGTIDHIRSLFLKVWDGVKKFGIVEN